MGRFLLLLILSLAATHTSFAADDPLITNAVGVFFSPRGQSYFRNNLEDLLYRNGWVIGQGHFPEGWKWEATEPLPLEHLPAEMSSYQPIIHTVRDTLTRWLVGFEFKDPLLSLSLTEASYQIAFQRLGLKADYDGLRKLGIDHAVLVNLEIAISDLQLKAGKIRLKDGNNPFLGEIGMDKAIITLSKKSPPIKLRVPFVLELNQHSGLKVTVLPVMSNLEATTLSTGFASPMVLPKLEIIVNGKRMPLNYKTVEADFRKQLPKLFLMAQDLLKEKLETTLPATLTSFLQAKIDEKATELTEVSELDPPGLENANPKDRFRFGMVPEEVEHTKDYLFLGISAFITDPKVSPYGASIAPKETASGSPEIHPTDPEGYDIAFAINQGLLNRALELSFNRGYYDKVSSGPSSSVRLLEPPRFQFESDPASKSGRIRLRLNIRKKVSGWDLIAVEGHLNVAFDMIIRMEKNKKGGLDFLMEKIDTDSVVVDGSTSRFGFLRGKVMAAVWDEVREKNAALKITPEMAKENFPIPSSLIGLPLAMTAMEVLSNGYLVVYNRFGEGTTP